MDRYSCSLDQFHQQRRDIFLVKSDSALADEELGRLQHRSCGDAGLDENIVRQTWVSTMGGNPSLVEPMAMQGTFHRLFRVVERSRTFVVRANALSEHFIDHLLHQEHRTVDSLRARGIPVPRIFHTDTSRTVAPFDFQIQEFVPGGSIGQFDDDDAMLLPLLHQLGEVLADVHRIDLKGFGMPDVRQSCLAAEHPASQLTGIHHRWSDYLLTRLETHLHYCQEVEILTVKAAEAIHERFVRFAEKADQSRSALLHGDLGNHNVISQGGHIAAIIDWEDCVIGDPVYDLAFWATFHPQRRQAALLRGYQEKASLPSDFEERFWLYHLRVTLAKVVHRIRFGYQDRPGRPTAAQRLDQSWNQLCAA